MKNLTQLFDTNKRRCYGMWFVLGLGCLGVAASSSVLTLADSTRWEWANYTSRSVSLTMADEDPMFDLFSQTRLSWSRWLRLPDNIESANRMAPAQDFAGDGWLPEVWSVSFRDAQTPTYRSVLVGATSDGGQELLLAGGGRVNDSPWIMAVSLEQLTSDGQVDNTSIPDSTWALRNTWQLRANLAWTEDDWLTGMSVVKRQQRIGDEWVLQSHLPERISEAGTAGYEKTSADGFNWFFIAHWGSGGNIRLDSEYTDGTLEVLQDMDRSAEDLAVFSLRSELEAWAHRAHIDYVWENGSQSELNIEWRQEKTLEGSMNLGLLLAPISSQPVTLAFLSDQRTTRQRINLGHQFRLTDALTAAFAWHHEAWDYERKEADKASSPGLLPGDRLFLAARSDGAFKADLGELILTWEQSDAISWTLGWMQTYVPGGVSYNLVSGLRRPFQPESGDRLEFDYTMTKGQWLHQVTAWYEAVEDKQVPVLTRSDNLYSSIVINVPKGYVQGLGYQGGWQSERTLVNWYFVWQDSGFSDLPLALRPLGQRPWPMTPQRKFELTFERQLADSWRFGLQLEHVAEQWLDVQSQAQDRLPDWTTVGAKIRYQRNGWAIELWGENLTDEVIYRYRSEAANLALLADGRQFGLRVEWQGAKQP